MKQTKKVLSLALISLVAASLAACKSNVNTQKPTGSLDLSKAHSSLASGEVVTVSEMYNLLRSKGYTDFTKVLNEQLLQKEMAAVNLEDEETKETINKNIISQIFSVSTVKDFKKLKPADKETKVLQFIHNIVSSTGIDYTSKKDNLTPRVSDDGESFECSFPTELIEAQRYSMALTKMSKDYIDSIKTKETLPDENGVEQKNQYYIGEKELKSRYENIKDYTSTFDLLNDKKDTKNVAIVIDFASEALAEKYISKALESIEKDANTDISTLTADEIKTFYVNLYNIRYGYTKNLTVDNINTYEGTAFSVTKDGNELSKIDSTILEFMKDKLVNEDESTEGKKNYTTSPLNLGSDNTRYMMFRVNLFEGKEWDDLSEEEKTKLNPELEKNIIDGWAGETLGSTLLSKRLKSENFKLEIYDPVYAVQYQNSHNEEYSLSSSFDNNKVFSFTYKYDDDAFSYKNEEITGTWTVEDSYKKLNSIYGAELAAELLTTKYLSSKEVLKKDFSDDLVSGYTDGVNDAIKTFKKGDSNYDKAIGEENFLVISYGYDKVSDVVNNKMLATNLKSSYNAYYGNFLGNEFKFADTGLFENFRTFTTKQYNSYYSLDIQHMLISIDVDGDGNFEDPEEIENMLSVDKVDLFHKELMKISDVLAREAEVITAKRMDAFKVLQKVFNNEGYSYILQSDKYKGQTFAEIKKDFMFDYALKAEDLGTIDSSNGSNYVEPFTNEVIELYNYLSNDDHKEDLDKVSDKGFWMFNDFTNLEGNPNEMLTKTNYGYHMIFVNKFNDKKSAKFTKEDDSKSSSDDTKKQYEDKKITVYKHDTDTTEDDETVIASGYSAEAAPSKEQLFIYFMEMNNKSSVTSMRSSTTTAVKTYFTSVMDRYNNTSFQSYKLSKQIGEITFADANVAASYKLSIDKAIKTVDSYKEVKEGSIFEGWFDLDWTIKF